MTETTTRTPTTESTAAMPIPIGRHLAAMEIELEELLSELLLAEQPRSKVLVTGADHDVGVTTISALAAHGIAQNLRRLTLLVEANVSNPGLGGLFPGCRGVGFSDYCRGGANRDDVVRQTDHPLLHVLPAGTLDREPGLLAAPGLPDRIEELTRVYDAVVFDAPPITRRPDVVLLVKECHGVVLVARAHVTHDDEVRAACHRIEMSGVPLIGTVLNRVTKRLPRWLEP